MATGCLQKIRTAEAKEFLIKRWNEWKFRAPVQAGEAGIRFLLVSGQPIEEPVAWYGPIVMNTEQELRTAYAELQEGTFLKPR